MMKPIIVESTHCHLWTDALHLRQLSEEAVNRWDRGTYVRMTVNTAWTVLETSCQSALNDPKIGTRFKENLDQALINGGFTGVDWSQGIWQKVIQLQALRNSYVHRYLALSELFPDASVATNAVKTVRDAVSDICSRVSLPLFEWLGIERVPGWPAQSNCGNATLASYNSGVNPDDPDAVRVYVVVGGDERLVAVYPAGSDPGPKIAQIVQSSSTPISGIRIYNGSVLAADHKVQMRGSV